jgi:hypothetical protein
VLVTLDGVRLDPGTDVGDDLLGEAPVRGGEDLLVALGGVHRLGEGDALHALREFVRAQEVGDLRLERDLERVLLDRRLEAAVGRGTIVELDGPPDSGDARPSDPDGRAGDAVDLVGLDTVAAGEAPGAVHEDPYAEAV